MRGPCQRLAFSQGRLSCQGRAAAGLPALYAASGERAREQLRADENRYAAAASRAGRGLAVGGRRGDGNAGAGLVVLSARGKVHDIDALTNIVFLRTPSRSGGPEDRSGRSCTAKEWLQIRHTIVRPAVGAPR
jgi:hypothetical protein